MKEFIDIFGRKILLIKEKWKHISKEHREVIPYLENISDTLKSPDLVKESVYNKDVLLYYKFYREIFNGKYLVVVVKYNDSNLILTCYITDRVKGGKLRWQKK